MKKVQDEKARSGSSRGTRNTPITASRSLTPRYSSSSRKIAPLLSLPPSSPLPRLAPQPESSAQTDRAGFQTDTDISGGLSGARRELQPWVPDAPEAAPLSNGAGRANGANGPSPGPGAGAARDSETFGAPGGGHGKGWDQFETNARLFGTKTSYQEEIYTTKLNRSGADYKKREKEAERLASEIMGVR